MNYIRLSYDNKNIILKLDDNDITRELVKELPIVLKFEDYSTTEKIAYFNKKYLNYKGKRVYSPQKGDLMYYAPWSYFTMFYNNNVSFDDYIKIGSVISGMMYLDELKGNVKIEMAV